MRLAILGDVHANATALQAALQAVDEKGYDHLVFLGDLLTYGADVSATLEVVGERLARGNAVLLRGNHDVIYEEMLVGLSQYGSALPQWIRESVEWTLGQLPATCWSRLDFANEHVAGGLLFSHANPYAAGPWEYVDTLADHSKAADAVRRRGLGAGIFGHTHRIRWYRRATGGDGAFRIDREGVLDAESVHIFNAGAIGQPRDAADPDPHVLWIEVEPVSANARFSFQRLSYDTAAHLRAVGGTGMSPETVRRITGFFVQA
jgi:predicted phosphodiesterase